MSVGNEQVTPPTPYLGDDEVTGQSDSGKSIADTQASAKLKADLSPSLVKAHDARTEQNTIEKVSLKDDGKDERSAGESSGEEEPTVKDEGSEVKVDPICAGESEGNCTLSSGDHRKVVSHIFGRNKRCTHQIPEDCWIKYCRKHYQRQKYRCPADWFETQLTLVDSQIKRMEDWGGITSWTVAIRKKEREMLDVENAYIAQHNRLPDGPTCRERFLLPYLGSNKTFQDIRDLIDIINKECDDTNTKSLPSFELLPVIDDRRNPRPRRGAVRRAGTGTTTTNPSTFRVATDSSGKVVKIAAPNSTASDTSGTSTRAPSTAPTHVSDTHAISRLPKIEQALPRPEKRSASTFDADNEQSDLKPARSVKRQTPMSVLAKQETKPIDGSARPAKSHASVLAKKEVKPINRLAHSAKPHKPTVNEKDEGNPTAAHPDLFTREPVSVFDGAADKKPEVKRERPVKRHLRSHSF
ncbi:MAG: hypothetical protein Q9197_005885 [Variospora fuerteventurae]